MTVAVDQLLRLNQCPLSGTSCRSFFNNLAFVGVTEVNAEESREGEYVDAQQQGTPSLGITSGQYKVDAFTFQMLADSGEFLCETLALSFSPTTGLALNSFGDARFSYRLEMKEPLGPVMSLSVNGCKIEKRKMGTQKGTGALTWDFECKAISMQTRGVGGGLTGLVQRLWSQQRAAL